MQLIAAFLSTLSNTLAALTVEPLHVDELAELWEGPGPAAAELVRLEMEGAVEALPGGLYALAAPARGRG